MKVYYAVLAESYTPPHMIASFTSKWDARLTIELIQQIYQGVDFTYREFVYTENRGINQGFSRELYQKLLDLNYPLKERVTPESTRPNMDIKFKGGGFVGRYLYPIAREAFTSVVHFNSDLDFTTDYVKDDSEIEVITKMDLNEYHRLFCLDGQRPVVWVNHTAN